jgi:hypothetical protein
LSRERDTNGQVIPAIYYDQFSKTNNSLDFSEHRLMIINKKSSGRFVMPSRNDSEHARARLQLETPISDDANLLNLQKQVEDFVREAKRRDTSEPNELVSTVVDTVARDYFRHAILKQRRPVRVSKGRRVTTGKPSLTNPTNQD